MGPSEPTAIASTYAEARARFLAACESQGAAVVTHRHPTEQGPDGGELAIDVARIGPVDATTCLLIVSGTHGVEGFAGSALQSHLLERLDRSPGGGEGPAIVFLHALNPFGFAWERRTNEDNVDLNRNFIDWNRPSRAGSPGGGPATERRNDRYDELAALLVPPVWNEDSKAATTTELLTMAAEIGIEDMQQIITGGQYRHEAGVFYGGTGPVWSHRWLTEHGAALVGPAARLGIVDLHTGLGPWGHGELIVHEATDDPVYRRAAGWWGDVRSMRDNESVSADLTGDWLGSTETLFPGVEITAAALEFGTIDEVSVLQALRAEAWMHVRGERVSDRADAVRAEVRAAFADDDPAWLAELTARFDEVVDAAVEQLSIGS